MKDKPLNFEQEFVNITSELGVYLGLNRTVGQIYGLLYINPSPVALEDIAKTLRISKGGASVNIRELERWGAVRKVWVQGSRKDFYEANQDFLNVAYSRIKNRVQKMLDSAEQRILRFENGNNLSEEQKGKLGQIKETVSAISGILKLSPDGISAPKLKKLAAVASTVKNIL